MAWQARKTHLTLPPTIYRMHGTQIPAAACTMQYAHVPAASSTRPARARYAVPVPAGGRDTACSSAI